MTQIREKRTSESATFDIICGGLLATGETILSVISVADDGGILTFGAPAINTSAVTYPDGYVAPIGTVIQVRISGGTIPTGSDSLKRGVPNLLCTIRAKFATAQSPVLEATVQMLLQDIPI